MNKLDKEQIAAVEELIALVKENGRLLVALKVYNSQDRAPYRKSLDYILEEITKLQESLGLIEATEEY